MHTSFLMLTQKGLIVVVIFVVVVVVVAIVDELKGYL